MSFALKPLHKKRGTKQEPGVLWRCVGQQCLVGGTVCGAQGATCEGVAIQAVFHYKQKNYPDNLNCVHNHGPSWKAQAPVWTNRVGYEATVTEAERDALHKEMKRVEKRTGMKAELFLVPTN